MVRPDEESSNHLFETFARWNAILAGTNTDNPPPLKAERDTLELE